MILAKLAPPSVVWAPLVPLKTAQEVAESHATEFKGPLGRFASPEDEEKVALLPDTVATSTVPDAPTIMHMVALGHETAASRFDVPVDTVVDPHDPPEFLMSSASPEYPTTKQTVADPQATACGSVTDPVTDDQWEPPSDVMSTAPPPELL
jgi:hypothetical protein